MNKRGRVRTSWVANAGTGVKYFLEYVRIIQLGSFLHAANDLSYLFIRERYLGKCPSLDAEMVNLACTRMPLLIVPNVEQATMKGISQKIPLKIFLPNDIATASEARNSN